MELLICNLLQFPWLENEHSLSHENFHMRDLRMACTRELGGGQKAIKLLA